MGKERRIRLKFHYVLPTSKKYLNYPKNTEPYFYKDYTISPQQQTPLISDTNNGLHFSLDHLLQNIPEDVKSVEFFEFNKNEIQKFKNLLENNVDLPENGTQECDSHDSRTNATNSSSSISKKNRQHNDFLKKFDVVNQARRLHGKSNEKKSQRFVTYDVLPIYVTIPTLKCIIPENVEIEEDEEVPSTPRKRLHSEKLKATILKGNEELNALKSTISLQEKQTPLRNEMETEKKISQTEVIQQTQQMHEEKTE